MDFAILHCDNCEQLKKDYVIKFGNLKKKIISTDLLIRQFNAKKNDQLKKLEDASLLIEQLQRDCRKYEGDLCQVLQEVEPLREFKQNQSRLVVENDTYRKKLDNLQSQLQAAEKSREQFVVKLKLYETEELQYKKEKLDFQEELQAAKKQLVALKKELAKGEGEEIKNELNVATKSIKLTRRKYKTAMKHLVTFGDLLRSNKLLSKKLGQILKKYIKELNSDEGGNNINSDSDADYNSDCKSAGLLLEQRLLADDSEHHDSSVAEMVDVCLSPMSIGQPELISIATQKDKEPDLMDTDLVSDLAQLFIYNISPISPLPPSPKRFRSREHESSISNQVISNKAEEETLSTEDVNQRQPPDEHVAVCPQVWSCIQPQQLIDSELTIANDKMETDLVTDTLVATEITSEKDLISDVNIVKETQTNEIETSQVHLNNEILSSEELKPIDDRTEISADELNVILIAHDHCYANCALLRGDSSTVDQIANTFQENLFENVDDNDVRHLVDSANVSNDDTHLTHNDNNTRHCSEVSASVSNNGNNTEDVRFSVDNGNALSEEDQLTHNDIDCRLGQEVSKSVRHSQSDTEDVCSLVNSAVMSNDVVSTSVNHSHTDTEDVRSLVNSANDSNNDAQPANNDSYSLLSHEVSSSVKYNETTTGGVSSLINNENTSNDKTQPVHDNNDSLHNSKVSTSFKHNHTTTGDVHPLVNSENVLNDDNQVTHHSNDSLLVYEVLNSVKHNQTETGDVRSFVNSTDVSKDSSQLTVPSRSCSVDDPNSVTNDTVALNTSLTSSEALVVKEPEYIPNFPDCTTSRLCPFMMESDSPDRKSRFTHFRVASPPHCRKPLVTFFKKGRVCELSKPRQSSHTSFVRKGCLFRKNISNEVTLIKSTPANVSLTPSDEITNRTANDPIVTCEPVEHLESQVESDIRRDSNSKCQKKTKKKSLREKVASSFKCIRGGQTISFLPLSRNIVTKKQQTAPPKKEVLDVTKIFSEVILSEHLRRPVSPFPCFKQPLLSASVDKDLETRPRLTKVRIAHSRPVREARKETTKVLNTSSPNAINTVIHSSISSVEKRITKRDWLQSNIACNSVVNSVSTTACDSDNVQISKKRKIDECDVVASEVTQVNETAVTLKTPMLPCVNRLPDVQNSLPNFDSGFSTLLLDQEINHSSYVKDAVLRVINGIPKMLKLAADNEDSYKNVAERISAAVTTEYMIHLAKRLLVWIKCSLKTMFSNSVSALTEDGLNIKDPVMDKMEFRTYKVVQYLEKNDKWSKIGDVMMDVITEGLMSERTKKVNMAALCRFHAALCRSRNNLHRARILCYDIMFNFFNMCGPLLVAILGVWPPVLMGNDRPVSVLHDVILFLLLKYHDRVGFMESVDSTHILKDVCKFSSEDCSSKEKASKLVEILKSGQQDVSFEALKGLELIAKVEGWEWTNNILILEELWPLLQRWCQKKSVEQISDDTVAHFIYLLGCLTKHCPVNNAASAQEILKAMQALLSTSSSVPVSICIQEAAVLAVLMLLPFNTVMGMSILNTWMDSTERPSSPSILRLIERARSKYPLKSR